jgi:hypothetical protein
MSRARSWQVAFQPEEGTYYEVPDAEAVVSAVVNPSPAFRASSQGSDSIKPYQRMQSLRPVCVQFQQMLC